VTTTTIGSQSFKIFVPQVLQPSISLQTLQQVRVGTTKTVVLGSIAAVNIIEIPTELKRIDQKLSANVTAPITVKNVGAVNQAVQKVIDGMTLPAGVTIGSGGVFEDMTESFSRMYIAILVAMVLSYVALVVTFRSFGKSLILMASLPLATIGGFLGLLITGHTLGVIGLMGILMLVGIVLTNAVVLIAYVEQLRKSGKNSTRGSCNGGRDKTAPDTDDCPGNPYRDDADGTGHRRRCHRGFRTGNCGYWRTVQLDHADIAGGPGHLFDGV